MTTMENVENQVRLLPDASCCQRLTEDARAELQNLHTESQQHPDPETDDGPWQPLRVAKQRKTNGFWFA
jgi:hypothetical protein